MAVGRLILQGEFTPPNQKDFGDVAQVMGLRMLYLAADKAPSLPDLERFTELEPILPEGVGREDLHQYGSEVKNLEPRAIQAQWRRLGNLFVMGMERRSAQRQGDRTLYREYASFPLRQHNDTAARRRLPTEPYSDVRRYDFNSLATTLDWMDNNGIVGGKFRPYGFGLANYIIWRGFVNHHQQNQLHRIIDRILTIE